MSKARFKLATGYLVAVQPDEHRYDVIRAARECDYDYGRGHLLTSEPVAGVYDVLHAVHENARANGWATNYSVHFLLTDRSVRQANDERRSYGTE